MFFIVETKLSAGGSLPVYRCADRWICFLSSKPGKFWDNRGGGRLPPKLILWHTRDSMRHTPKKNFPSPAAGLFWPLFSPLFYLCFYHYLYLQKKIFFACGGLVLTLSLPLFLPLFLTVFYLLFYPCWTFIFALFLPLFLPSKKILRLRRACFDPYFYLYFTFVFTIIQKNIRLRRACFYA